MAANNSSVSMMSDKVVLVQVFVAFFLFINALLIVTFFKKDAFFTTMRYILFAVTLMGDCVFLLVSDILLVFNYYSLTIKMWLCFVIYLLLSVYTFVTPVTLTAMTLERYVAICMSLRHGELCSTHRALHCIFIIHSLSMVPCVVFLSVFFASVTQAFYAQDSICSVENFIIHSWQSYLRSAISQAYFLVMCVAILFSYVKIIKVARAASGENKKSSLKGLRTVVLHGFQLLLCLTQLWTPFIETAVLRINVMLFVNIRYFNYVTFILAPRCLSPLIYGLRDETFFHALKSVALCGLHKKQSLELN